MSLNHISPLLGGEPANGNENSNGVGTSGNSNGTSNGNNNSQGQQSMPGIEKGTLVTGKQASLHKQRKNKLISRF